MRDQGVGDDAALEQANRRGMLLPTADLAYRTGGRENTSHTPVRLR